MKIEPQCVEGKDGFPKSNPKFLKQDEALLVLKGIKPVCIRNNAIKDKYPELKWIKYKDTTSVFYRDDTEHHARALIDLKTVANESTENAYLADIVMGLLLGYRMEDIRAWHFTGPLESIFMCDYFDNRKRIVQDPSSQMIKAKFFEEFEKAFCKAVNLRDKMLQKYTK